MTNGSSRMREIPGDLLSIVWETVRTPPYAGAAFGFAVVAFVLQQVLT